MADSRRDETGEQRGARRFALPGKVGKSCRPAAGRDLTIDEIAASDDYETARTRDHIAKLILWGATVALSAAVVVSVIGRSFAPLGAVWAVVGPFAGGIVTYYFYHDPKR
jgi:hypothetical protein